MTRQRADSPALTTVAHQVRAYEPSWRHWLTWQHVQPELAGRSFQEVRRSLLDPEFEPDRKDALLGALIELSGVDDVAVVCVAGCLYPGLSRLAWRYRDVLDHDASWSAIVESLTTRLRSASSPRAANYVAVDLLRAINHDVRRIARAERAWRDRVELVGMTRGVDSPTPPPVEIDGDPLASCRELSCVDGALIRSTRGGGLGLADAAHLLGLTYEAAKKRRQRAESVLRIHLGAAAAARQARRPRAA